MIVAVLAVWKSGAAFVPLDPKLPKDRLQYMLEKSKACAVVTHTHLRGILPDLEQGVAVIDMDVEWPIMEAKTVHDKALLVCPESKVTPRNLAYLLFTSGSTGLPKGVMVEHRSLVNFLVNVAPNVLCTKPEDVCAQSISYAFDASIADTWGPLTSGATLVLKPNGVVAGSELAQFINEHGATTLGSTPAVCLSIENADMPTLKNIVTGGEALPLTLVQQLGQGRRLINVYGPTEATIYCTAILCDPSEPYVTIGKACRNYQMYVLDAHMQPVPIGVPGELYIGGVGVARGYIGNEEATKSRFVRNPFADALPPARWNKGGEHLGSGMIYKTGDVVKYLSDGQLEYVGRVDFQVKLRGLRIELGEIESVLIQHAGVSNAVVLVREDTPGQQMLVAFVHPSDVAVNQLKAFASSKLPQYMVPQVVVALDSTLR